MNDNDMPGSRGGVKENVIVVFSFLQNENTFNENLMCSWREI